MIATDTHPDPIALETALNREPFLKKLFGWDFLLGELNVMFVQNHYAPIRIRGEWWRFESKAGVRFLAPPITEAIRLDIASNGFAGPVSPEAAGIIFTLGGLVLLMEQGFTDQTPFNSHRDLLAWSRLHPEADTIRNALD